MSLINYFNCPCGLMKRGAFLKWLVLVKYDETSLDKKYFFIRQVDLNIIALFINIFSAV
jgi:hypothetical protein